MLRMCEIALYKDYDNQDFRPPFFLTKSPKSILHSIGPVYYSTITRCKTSSTRLLQIICGLNAADLSAMPHTVLVRMMYALVVLYKIFILSTSPSHPLAAVLDADGLCLPTHLTGLLKILSDLNYQHSFRESNKFLAFVREVQDLCLSPTNIDPSNSIGTTESEWTLLNRESESETDLYMSIPLEPLSDYIDPAAWWIPGSTVPVDS